MTLRIALVLAAAGLSLSACERVSDEMFGQKVRAYLLEHPEVLVEVSKKLDEKQAAEQAQVEKASYAKYRAELEADPRDFVANPNGKITVVELYAYKCGWCKRIAPEVMTLIKENPDVRFVFKEYPIFGGESVQAAAIMASPAVRPKALELHARLMNEKALDAAAVDRHLAAAGLDPAAVRKAAASEAVQRHLSDNHQLAQALGIEGTPHFVVGDTIIKGADLEALRIAIGKARTAGAGKQAEDSVRAEPAAAG
jgi:protein-disulfide isomerase